MSLYLRETCGLMVLFFIIVNNLIDLYMLIVMGMYTARSILIAYKLTLAALVKHHAVFICCNSKP